MPDEMNKREKHVNYAVWVEIERQDGRNGGQYETLDAPGASLVSFPTYGAAWKHAEDMTKASQLWAPMLKVLRAAEKRFATLDDAEEATAADLKVWEGIKTLLRLADGSVDRITGQID